MGGAGVLARYDDHTQRLSKYSSRRPQTHADLPSFTSDEKRRNISHAPSKKARVASRRLRPVDNREHGCTVPACRTNRGMPGMSASTFSTPLSKARRARESETRESRRFRRRLAADPLAGSPAPGTFIRSGPVPATPRGRPRPGRHQNASPIRIARMQGCVWRGNPARRLRAPGHESYRA